MNRLTQTPAKALIAGLTLFTFFALALLPARAVEIQTVTSEKGVTALLVEDYTVPIVALQFSFKGGSLQDADGKEGTARLLTTLLDEGAGDIESKAFQEKLDEVGVEYSFNASLDNFSGGIKALRINFVESADMLALMLNKPRFDADPIERMKTSALTNLRRQENNPRTLSAKALREATFGDHPYARPSEGTAETIEAISVDDLRGYKDKVFARDNLVIGVVGAISADELKPILDAVFASLPEKADLRAIPEATIEAGKSIHVDLNVPQTTIGFVMPGLKRDDPDFFAAYLVNHVLGGGSFSSRLYEEVREKRGLAYGVYSFLGTYDYAGTVGAGSATNAAAAQQTIDIMRAEMKRMGEEGPTAEELEKAKKFIIGTYAISNLDSSSKIASVLVAIQQADLGLDYIDRREDYLNQVTLEQAKRVANELFGGEPTQVTVGQKLTN
ncbi:M16 family metallopeptidase [Pseudahrensia aquimaris]|uniref:M16 family metallopeptidase n=1 Tax=Pseudahrensia aquimaris TaxID=744461 RepID=A0ABW3FD70_9HYPH